MNTKEAADSKQQTDDEDTDLMDDVPSVPGQVERRRKPSAEELPERHAPNCTTVGTEKGWELPFTEKPVYDTIVYYAGSITERNPDV
jgi:hypothetical protein